MKLRTLMIGLLAASLLGLGAQALTGPDPDERIETRVLELEFGTAESAAGELRERFSELPLVVADPRANAVIVRGKRAELDAVCAAAEELDARAGSASHASAGTGSGW